MNEAAESFTALYQRHATSCLALKMAIGRKSRPAEWSHIDATPRRIEFQQKDYCSSKKEETGDGELLKMYKQSKKNLGGTQKSKFYAKMWKKMQIIVFVRWPRSVE